MKPHNVDLASLSADQLVQLMIDAKEVYEENVEKNRKISLKKLKESGELPALKETLKTLKEGCKELKKVSFKLSIPIEFTIQTDLELSELNYDPDCIFEQSLTGTIPKDCKELTTAQVKALKETVEDTVLHACSDILDIVPEKISDKFEKLKKDFVALDKKVRKHGLTLEDL